MAKRPRIAGPKLYHHIYAWGNDRHPIFKNKSHHEIYLRLLHTYASHYGVDVIAYALMEWHVHLFVFDSLGKLSNFMNSLHGRYAQYYNAETDRAGHVFGERFNNKIVQVDTYGIWLSRYIHRQPLDAGLVEDPKDYLWTSYRSYLGLEHKEFLYPAIVLEQFGQGKEALQRYEDFVLGEEEGLIKWDKITTPVIGDDAFVENMDSVLIDVVHIKKENLTSEEYINIMCKRFGCKTDILLNPQGMKERKLRHSAFDILIKEHGLSPRHVAHLFHVTPMTVVKARKDTAEIE